MPADTSPSDTSQSDASTTTAGRLRRTLRSATAGDVVAAFALLAAVLGVAFAIYGLAQADRADAEHRDQVAAALKQTYGADVLEHDRLPTAAGWRVEVMTRLPSGLTRCDVLVEKEFSTVALLCGSDRVEPPRR